MLKLCQSKRLGNGRQGVGAIKKHRWFSGFGWDDLLDGKLKPPVDVKVQNDGDAHNFDTYDEQKTERVARRSWRPALDD